MIYTLLLKNKNDLQKLKAKMRKSNLQVAEFEKMITKLTKQIEKKDKEIDKLKTELSARYLDIDYLLLPFDFFNEIHRVVTHNLIFIVFFASIFMFFYKNEYRFFIFISGIIGGLLHLIVDSCMDNNPSNGIGVAFLWPFIDETFSIYNFSSSIENNPGWNRPFEAAKHAIKGLIWEIPFVVIAMLIRFKKKISDKILAEPE